VVLQTNGSRHGGREPSGMGRRLVFVGHRDGDGGLGFVDVERAASGNKFDEFGGAGVVADIKGDGYPVNT